MRVQRLTLISVLMVITMGITSCASYLYTLYVPASAYYMAQGIKEGYDDARYADAGTGIAQINAEMEKNGSAITLAKTYEAAYGKALKSVPPDGNTGQVFDDMRTATRYFRNILRDQGIATADDFVLTRLENHSRKGFMLVAAVYRPHPVIKINDPENPEIRKVLTPESSDYYRPYQVDSSGRPLDVVAEWAAVPVNCFKTQGQQAMFLTEAANNVIEKKDPSDFWQAMKKWKTGDIESVVVAQNYLTCQSLGAVRG